MPACLRRYGRHGAGPLAGDQVLVAHQATAAPVKWIPPYGLYAVYDLASRRAPAALSSAVMDAAQVRRWIAGFEAAAEADRQALRRRGADPTWSIRLALSMIDAARHDSGQALRDPLREAEAERVRSVWARLRQRLLR